jgi:hypothetical protein
VLIRRHVFIFNILNRFQKSTKIRDPTGPETDKRNRGSKRSLSQDAGKRSGKAETDSLVSPPEKLGRVEKPVPPPSKRSSAAEKVTPFCVYDFTDEDFDNTPLLIENHSRVSFPERARPRTKNTSGDSLKKTRGTSVIKLSGSSYELCHKNLMCSVWETFTPYCNLCD